MARLRFGRDEEKLQRSNINLPILLLGDSGDEKICGLGRTRFQEGVKIPKGLLGRLNTDAS